METFALPLVPLLSLLGALGSAVERRWRGPGRGAAPVSAIVGSGLAWVLGWSLAVGWWADGAEHWSLAVAIPWLAVGGDSLPGLVLGLGFRLDGLSAAMLAATTAIGLLVQLAAPGFEDKQDEGDVVCRWGCLGLINAGVLTLVLAADLPTSYLGWEVVLFGSYLTVMPRRGREPFDAGMRVLVCGRLGAAGMLLATMAAAISFGTVEAAGLREVVAAADGAAVVIVGAFLLLGALVGAAQLPFRGWVVDAGSASSPLAALVLSSLLLAAGAHVLLRFDFLVTGAPSVAGALAIAAVATAVIVAAAASVQTDLRRILVNIAVAQVAFGLLGVAVGASRPAVLHLSFGAVATACLVLGLGAAMRQTGAVDIRELGGAADAAPVGFWSAVVAALLLGAAPPLAGFLGRDAILARVFAATGAAGGPSLLLWCCALLATGLSTFAVLRVVLLVFLGRPRNAASQPAPADRESSWLSLPLAVAAVGVLFVSTVVAFAGRAWEGADADATLTVLTAVVVVAAGAFAVRLYGIDPELRRARDLATTFGLTRRLLLEELWIDTAVRMAVVRLAVAGARWLDGVDRWWVNGTLNGLRHVVVGLSWLLGIVDRMVIDGVINRVGGGVAAASVAVRRLQTGLVPAAVVVLVVSAAALLGLVFVAYL